MRRRAYAVVVLALAAAIATTMVTIAGAGPTRAPARAAGRVTVRSAGRATVRSAGRATVGSAGRVTVRSAGRATVGSAARRPALAGDRRALRVLVRRMSTALGDERPALRAGHARARSLTLVTPQGATCGVGLGRCSLHPCVELVGSATAPATASALTASPAVATAAVVTARPGDAAPAPATAVRPARSGHAPTDIAVPAVRPSPCVRAPSAQSMAVSVVTATATAVAARG